ncbi:hypothetical protein [Streptomyces sp. NPDC002067]
MTIRVRRPESIIDELHALHDEHGVTAFRFVDDLFLGAGHVITEQMAAFTRHGIGDRFVWDATGRINVLDHLVANGLREVARVLPPGRNRSTKPGVLVKANG